jgi:hypothetical protein
MDKKEFILTVAKEILISAMNNPKIALNIRINRDEAIIDIGERFSVLVDKVKSIYDSLETT